MEFKLRDINVCDYSRKISTTCNVEADIIVPDTKPDIYRILCVNAVCDLDERYIRKDKIIFSGNVKFDIMYIGEAEKNRIYNIEYTSPFNHQCDLAGSPEDAVSISECTVSSTDFKVKNSRKLSAGCALAINARAMKHSTVSAVEEVDGDDAVPCRTKSIKSDSMIVCREIDFTLSDTLNLPARGDDIQIHDFNVRIDASDIKTVNNKAIIKGNLPARILYSTGAEPETYETEFSFTEIADLDMANAESVISSHFDVCDISYTLDDAEDETSLELDIRVKGYICAFETSEYSLACDMYSPDFGYQIKSAEQKTESFSKLNETQITVKDNLSLDTSMSDISRIHYMNVYPSYNRISSEKSSVKLSGDTQVIIIYSNEDGELFSARKLIPYEVDIPYENSGEQTIFDASVSAVNYGYILGASHEVQARTVLKISVDAISSGSLRVITDFSEDRNSPLDKSGQASITVCYPDSSQGLWDYAVKYNTTCEEIAAINNIDPESKLISGKPLLIPKRQRS